MGVFSLRRRDMFSLLPEECIAYIISLTTPRDACRSSVLSTTFRPVADSDDVWGGFLPPECRDLFPHLSRKVLYFHLCDYALPMGDDESMSLCLERESGKKCWMIGAKALAITWVHDPRYWRWIPTPEFRFPQAAVLLCVWWLHIVGKIDTKMLSPRTNYAAYFVFNFADSMDIDGFRQGQVTLRVSLEESLEREEQMMYLVSPQGMQQPYRERGDGWMEIRLGQVYNNNGGGGILECIFRQVDNNIVKSGLIVGGIELRPAATTVVMEF